MALVVEEIYIILIYLDSTCNPPLVIVSHAINLLICFTSSFPRTATLSSLEVSEVDYNLVDLSSRVSGIVHDCHLYALSLFIKLLLQVSFWCDQLRTSLLSTLASIT